MNHTAPGGLAVAGVMVTGLAGRRPSRTCGLRSGHLLIFGVALPYALRARRV